MKNIFLALLLVTLTMPAFAADQKESAFDRVMRTRTIQCGYILYEPVVMKDPNTGEISGLMPEIMSEIASRLNMKIEWTVESSYATYSEDIKKPNVDLLCSTFWGGVEVGQFGITAMPLWYSGVGIYVRADDTRFDKNYWVINDSGVTISSVDGTIPADIAKKDFPKAKILSSPAMSDYSVNLLNVANGKADVTFVEVSQGAAFLKNNPGQLKNIIPDAPLRVYPNSVLVSVHETEIWHFMNSALIDLKSEGLIDRLVDKYEPAPGAWYRMANPYKPYEVKK